MPNAIREIVNSSENGKRLTHPIVVTLTLDTREDALSWVWRILREKHPKRGD